jgi:hypothetical protein
MKTETEWSQEILKITMEIQQEFPELSKYIKEMPVKVVEKDEEGEYSKVMKEYYDSLKDLVGDYSKTHPSTKEKKDPEHLYKHGKEEADLNPEDLSKNKAPNEKPGTTNELGFEDDKSGDDLDVPGSELDDQQESVGNEDEENNYYSLGGDNHHNLEDGKG